jgi:hypothetical protein
MVQTKAQNKKRKNSNGSEEEERGTASPDGGVSIANELE